MVLEFFRKAEPPVEAKASATGKVLALANAGRVAWSPRDTASLTRNGFQGNPVGFRCVKMIAEAARCLVEDKERLPARYGVLTPAAAMGEVLIERMRKTGMEFSTL